MPAGPAMPLGLIVSCVVGCATFGSGSRQPEGAPEKALAISAQGVAVHVINDNPADVRVYLIRGSTPIRLATVGSFEQRLVWISPAEAPSSGTLQLMVQPAGSPTPHLLSAVDLMPGGAVELWVRANIRLSHAVARPSSPR